MVLDFIEILKVIFLGIVEGITEWLPISSTGHMILVDEFITLNMSEAFKEMFFVVIQLGAILAVVVMFWNKMFPFQFKNKAQSIVKKDTFSLWFKVAVACVPSAIMGILFDDYLDAYLQTPIVISIMLIFYGLLFILIENWNKKRTPTTMALSDISYKTAILIFRPTDPAGKREILRVRAAIYFGQAARSHPYSVRVQQVSVRNGRKFA